MIPNGKNDFLKVIYTLFGPNDQNGDKIINLKIPILDDRTSS